MASPVTDIKEDVVEPKQRGESGVTLRAIVIGLVVTVLIDLWIHYAELVLGGIRGHTALANTSIPVGSFSALFALVFINIGLTRFAPSLRLCSAELLTIYVMSAVSSVLSSSGGMHFLIPTITAAHYFNHVDPTGNWAAQFINYVPKWMAQSNLDALNAFYKGGETVNLHLWAKQIAIWCGFLIVFTTSTLCIVFILRKQWIERERLSFPTVMLPLELAKDGAPILRDRFFWIGTIATFAIVCWNTAALNYPSLPHFSMRAMDLSASFPDPPWNAMNPVMVTFFPFVIGIGYLLSTEVVFSCWFFYLLGQAESVLGAAMGWSTGAIGTGSVFPWRSCQAVGSFLGLAALSIWISRQHLKEVFAAAFGDNPNNDPEAKGYRLAVLGLIFSALAMVVFTVVAGASVYIAVIWVILMLAYLLAATRIRAETGNAWPVGPEIDAFKFLVMLGGSGAFRASDLTALTYVRAATAQQDFRGVCMSHQLDGFKMADSAGIKPGKMAWAMIVAVAFGTVVSFIIALYVWTKFGALAKTDTWRSMMGKKSFDMLGTWLKTPSTPDRSGLMGVGLGVVVTMFLSYMRMRYVWWPFHPVGYCMSTTWLVYNTWLPFLIAWLAKVIIIKTGGMKLYKKMMPLFLGLIAGDFLGGALTTLIGCFSHISVYPVNW
jgi:hypothetical protein